MINSTIYKYTLALEDEQVIQMPAHAEILSVANQNGNLCLWAKVIPSNKLELYKIYIVGTGNPADHVENNYFIGTVIMNPFVWHIFLEDFEP